jgi:hypothetical protein
MTLMAHSFHRKLTFATALVMLAGTVGTASAETTWQKNHPRRTQINHRARVLNRQENALSRQIPPK